MHPVAELESALLTPTVRRSRRELGPLLQPDFKEVGAGGRLWTRDEIIAHLADADDHEPIVAVQLEVLEVTPEIVLVTFVTDPGGRAARRSWLWRSD